MKRVISRTILALVLASSLCASVIPVTVSYTHLDVYKRQLEYRRNDGNHRQRKGAVARQKCGS